MLFFLCPRYFFPEKVSHVSGGQDWQIGPNEFFSPNFPSKERGVLCFPPLFFFSWHRIIVTDNLQWTELVRRRGRLLAACANGADQEHTQTHDGHKS